MEQWRRSLLKPREEECCTGALGPCACVQQNAAVDESCASHGSVGSTLESWHTSSTPRL